MISPGFSVHPIRTEIFKLKDNLHDFIVKSLGQEKLFETDVFVVTSKIVSLSENRVVSRDSIDKKELVQKEADFYLGEIGYGCHLTVKHGLMIPSAGIDESNASGDFYILYPENPFESAKKLWESLRMHYRIKNLGVVITDSHTTPMRKGVTGISLAHWGIKGVQNFVGKKDLFGRTLQMTQVNAVDALAAASVFAMGEAAEKIPLALVRNATVEFVSDTDQEECKIALEKDLYYPLLKGFLLI